MDKEKCKHNERISTEQIVRIIHSKSPESKRWYSEYEEQSVPNEESESYAYCEVCGKKMTPEEIRDRGLI